MSNGFYTQLTDRAVLRVSGADALGFLQGLVTNDVEHLAEDRAAYAALLTPQGKILFDFFVIREADGFLLDCAASQAAELAKRLTFYKLRAAVDIADVSDTYKVAAAWGDAGNCGLGAEAGKTERDHNGIRFTDPRSADAGVRVLGSEAQIEMLASANELAPEDLARYHAHRIAQGLADSEADIGSGELFPHETNLDQINGVDFRKGCYVGQEVVSRTEHRATARKRIVPVAFEGDAPATGSDITAGERSIGTLLSSSGSRAIALIRLDRAQSAIEDGIAITAEGQHMKLEKPDWASFDVPGSGG